jgi:hypothetical protein
LLIGFLFFWCLIFEEPSIFAFIGNFYLFFWELFSSSAHLLFGLFFFKIFILFICAYNVWVISPPFPHPLPYTPQPPRYPAETILPLSLILL